MTDHEIVNTSLHMGRLRSQILGVFFAALYVLSAATLGFAHTRIDRLISAEASYGEAAAYQLPDGSLPDICFGHGEDDSGKPILRVCDACLLVSSGAIIPVAPGVETFICHAVEVGRYVETAPLLATRNLLIQQPRAPPFQI